jgi:hypothetical protein
MSNKCLQCGKACGDAIFCSVCQAALLQRSQLRDGSVAPPAEAEQEEVWSPLVVHLPAANGAPLAPAMISQREQQAAPAKVLQREQQITPSAPVLTPVSQMVMKSDADEQSARVAAVPSSAAPDPHTHPISRPLWSVGHGLVDTPRLKLVRIIFLILLILAVVAILVDGGLLALVMQRQSQASSAVIPPMITLTPTVVHPGQIALIHISHFPAEARVLVTRDIGEPARLGQSSPFVKVDGSGTADVRIFIDEAWGLGTHYIDSEDVATHYTASTAVQIISTKQERPPLLSLDQRSLDLGADYTGANTLQAAVLKNVGGGVISWSASSDQSWLSLTPAQGTFNTQQPLTVAVSRAHLLPCQYAGTITFTSNAGPALQVHVSMAVRAIPATAGAVLSVTAPALSFAVSDGGTDPGQETLTISNPGTKSLHWSVKSLTPTFASDQNVPLTTQTAWLDAQPAAGDVAPAMTATVHVFTHSQTMLPGSYSGVLSFTSDAAVLNAPQPVAVSLSILPRCSPALSLSSFSLTGFAGHDKAAQQDVGVSLPATCSTALSWKALSLSPGLSLAPDHGMAQNRGNVHASVRVDSTHLSPGSYTGSIIFVSSQRTQTVPVQFTLLPQSQQTTSVARTVVPQPAASPMSTSAAGTDIQPTRGTATPGAGSATDSGGAPTPSAPPTLAVSAANLSFATGQGQNSAPQLLTLTNESATTVRWQAMPDAQGLVSMSVSNGELAAGQSEQVVIQCVTSDLAIGNYSAHLALSASGSDGQPIQVTASDVAVAIAVGPPCIMHVTPSSLYFTSILSLHNPPDQTIAVQSSGYCVGPVNWSASIYGRNAGWLSLSSMTGSVDSTGKTLYVSVNSQSELLGWKHAQIVFSATDGNGNTVAVDNQTVSVTLDVLLSAS